VEVLDEEFDGGEGGSWDADPDVEGVDEGGADAFGGESVGIFEGCNDILVYVSDIGIRVIRGVDVP